MNNILRETLKEAVAGIAEKNGDYKIKIYYEDTLAHDYIGSDLINSVLEQYGDRYVESYDYSNGEYSFLV